jgi:hypothetical protein
MKEESTNTEETQEESVFDKLSVKNYYAWI